jgi:hypothetical protein
MVREYLIRNGRHSDFRVWRGLGDRNSSDEEWEADFRTPGVQQREDVDPQVDTRRIVDDAFQGPHEATVLEDRVQDAFLHAFIVADRVHAECIRNDGDETNLLPDYSVDEPIGETNALDTSENDTFDPHALEEAIRPLYRGAKCTQLAATILLMNLCTVHGVTNGFADELFTILNSHLPPTENVLPKNYYAARSLTAKLGLSYNSIHAYDKGCVLFRGEHVEAVGSGRRYRSKCLDISQSSQGCSECFGAQVFRS